jgi:hypothetical protein
MAVPAPHKKVDHATFVHMSKKEAPPGRGPLLGTQASAAYWGLMAADRPVTSHVGGMVK